MSYDTVRQFILTAACLLFVVVDVWAQIPAAPSNVSLIVRRDNAIDVFWQDNSNNESAFDVFRKSGNGAYSLLGAVDANITFFQDRNSGIRPNVEYCYRVDARNASGSSPRSNEACIVVPPRPNSPTGLQLSKNGDQSPIVLNWNDESGNEDFFLVYRDTDGAAFVLYDTVRSNITTFSDIDLRPTGNYCYFVSAANSAGESAGSDPACLNVPTATPVPPTNMTVTSVSASSVKMQWTFTLINFLSQTVERSSDSEASWTDVFTTDQVIDEYLDDTVEPNTEYCYRIRVENATGTPGFSSSDCGTTSFGVPDPPQNVAAVGLVGSEMAVSWDLVDSAEILYRVERSAGDVPFVLLADSVAATATSDSGLDSDLIYCYRVRAFNPEFESEWSETACGIVAPDAVANLSAAPDAASPTDQIKVSWNSGQNVGADTYAIIFRPVGDGPFSDPMVVDVEEIVVSNLDEATAYEFSVTAQRKIDALTSESTASIVSARTFFSFWPGDVNGDGRVSAEDVVALAAPACFGAATNFSTAGSSVAWSRIAIDIGEQDPSVVRCDTDRTGVVDIFDFLAIAANAGQTTGKSVDVAPATIVDNAHRARVESLYDSFQPHTGNAAQQRLKEDLAEILSKSVQELPERLVLESVYPNPVSGTLSATVGIPKASKLTIEIVNAAGQTVKRIQDQSVEAGRTTISIDVRGLSPALYFVRVRTSSGQTVSPITVVR